MLKGLRKRLAIIFTAFTGAVLAAVLVVSFIASMQKTVQGNEQWFSSAVSQVATAVMTMPEPLADQPSIYPGQYVVCVRRNGQTLEGVVATAEQQAAAGITAGAVGEELQAALFEQAKAEAGAQLYLGSGPTQYILASSAFIAEEAGVVEEAVDFEISLGPGGVPFYVATPLQELEETLPADTVQAYEGQVSVMLSVPAVLPSAGDTASVDALVGTSATVNTMVPLEYEGRSYRSTYFSWETIDYPGGRGDVYEIALLEDLGPQRREVWLAGLWHLLLLAGGVCLLFLANWFLARLVLRPTEDGLRRQTEFVAAASHELRSPLAVIRSSLAAAEETPEPAQARRFRVAADEEARRMGTLVDDLLLAGGDAGSWQLEKTAVDMDTLLIDAAESYRAVAREKQVELCLELPGEALPQVQGDAERLRQILTVLLDNALQYAPKGSEINLAAGAKRGRVWVSVADAGCGIPDEEKEKVFQRFYRADRSRHDKNHFGLGLAIARELAELHGGRLTVDDSKKGGAAFTLQLPAA